MDITIGRLRGGYCVYWHEGGKRRRYRLEARTAKEAEAEARAVYARHRAEPEHLTVGAIWEAYRESLGERPTAATMKWTGKPILSHFGAYRPDHVDTALCKAYAQQRDAKGLSQGSTWTELGHLRSALLWAQREGLLASTPHIWRPTKPAPREVFYTAEELGRLIDGAAVPHIRLALQLLSATAARVGAVLDLTWDRVDLEARTIDYRLKDSVTRKGRAIVPINDGLRAALAVHRDLALSDYVVEHAGKRVGKIARGFATARKNAGLDGVTIHDIRRSAAAILVTRGVKMELVAQILGHSNLAMTYSVYGRFQPSGMREAAEILDFTKRRMII